MKNGPRRETLLAGSLAFSSIVLFAILLALFSDHEAAEFWKAVAAAALAVAAFAGGIEILRRRRSSTDESPARLLHRITAGDLTFRTRDIEETAGSEEMAAALRALLLSLERTIRRFSQLATDVGAVSEQIGTRSRVLARSATLQLGSTETTAVSVTQIDESINSVQKTMENLSMNAEETSASILEMSASIEEVGRIADTLTEFVEETASAIQEMTASINEVATNTESFSSFAIETASSMVEMNATTEEIGKSAKNSSDLARYVTDAANDGREAVASSAEGMRKIQQSVEEAKIALNMLGERSEEIGEIVRVIDEIAGQTNLLALNAAIIAAQAGERGKGFAVVADEIRDLSERTSVSTEEIRTLIRNVQKGVERAAEHMTISAERVGEGVSLTSRAEQVLAKILDLTERSREAISEIARATEEQARGSQAATVAIEEVTKMIQQTAVATQQQSQTSTSIGEQAARVRDYMKHLKRAMDEQESGSRSISQAMENIMQGVSYVLEATSVLATESASIVKSMGAIKQGAREGNFSVSDLNQMASTLRHESSLLTQELHRFELPAPTDGGRVTTATVLPHKLTLDPAFCQFMALGFMNKAIHETLVQFGEGAELMPGLAERWEILEHGTIYRFHLRPGIRFHNGRPVTSADVRDTFLRLMSPELNSGGRWIMRNIKGAQGVMDGTSRTAEGLVVVDNQTIDIVLTEPLAFFLLLLSMPETGIIPVEETGEAIRSGLHSIGAGPFIVEEAIPGERVRLRRNPNHYASPHVDELTFRLDLKSARDVSDAFLRGEIDIAHGIPLAGVRDLRNDPRLAPYLLDTIQLHTSYLTYDCGSPPFDRVEVRQAVNYAINRERINEKIFSGLGVIAESLLPPGLIGYDTSLRGYSHDPDRARTLLRQAGLSSGFDIDYWTWDTDEFNNSGLIPLVLEDLAAVGIRTRVAQHTATEVREHQQKIGHGTLFAGNWYADFPDSDNFFFIFFHSESNTIRGMNYRNPELDALIEEARRTNDNERRAQIYRDLNRKTLEEAPVVYLFHDRFFVIHRPEVRGLRTYLVPPPVRYQSVWLEK
ncbi:MAG TPA: ABC transporter substrate-binding protein [Thermoanaerobaculia bacterium]|nr:ABC transporter substrate-binding protein [Thermoanaerobaculia bacterium]